jgi:hypothetical protein
VFVVESKLISDIFMVTCTHFVSKLKVHIVSKVVTQKKLTHFEFFSKSHIIYLDLKNNP